MMRLWILLLAAFALAAACQSAPSFTGRWTYQEQGETVVLDLTQNAQTGTVGGTITMLGATVPIDGRAQGPTLVLERMDGLALSATGSSMTGRLDGSAMVVTITSAGDPPKSMRMTRAGGAKPPTNTPGVASDSQESNSSPPAATTSADTREFAGRWEAESDDKTNLEAFEVSASGATMTGELLTVERGYFSGRQTITAQYGVRGSLRGGLLEVTITDVSGQLTPFPATLFRRDEYLVIRMGQTERGFARPGRPLVQSAERSAEAAALARAIAGHVYSSGGQAAGRGGFVGGRVRLALCSDGRIEYDASNLASVPGSLPGQGVDLGDSVARRGTWSVVLRAGAPAVRAQWQGTGTSYSLTRYFLIRPSTDGRSAVVDDSSLPVNGDC